MRARKLGVEFPFRSCQGGDRYRIDFRIGSGVGKVDLSLKRRSQRTVWYTEQWCTSHSFWAEVLVLTSLCFGNLCFSQVFQRLNFLSCGYKVNWLKRFSN